MNKLVRIVGIVFVLLMVASPALAQEEGATEEGASALITLDGTFAAGLVVIGAAMGIGRLAGAALESMARQPEVANNIQTAMIIAAALIEGFTFYALYICSTGV